MKSIISITALFLVVSCAHNHKHESGVEAHDHKGFKEVHQQQKEDHKRATKMVKWLQEEVKHHQKVINEHEEEIKSHEAAHKYWDKKGSDSLKAKKAILELHRKHQEMTDEHAHHANDHEELMEIVEKIEAFKKDLESHGHDH